MLARVRGPGYMLEPHGPFPTKPCLGYIGTIAVSPFHIPSSFFDFATRSSFRNNVPMFTAARYCTENSASTECLRSIKHQILRKIACGFYSVCFIYIDLYNMLLLCLSFCIVKFIIFQKLYIPHVSMATYVLRNLIVHFPIFYWRKYIHCVVSKCLCSIIHICT